MNKSTKIVTGSVVGLAVACGAVVITALASGFDPLAHHSSPSASVSPPPAPTGAPRRPFPAPGGLGRGASQAILQAEASVVQSTPAQLGADFRAGQTLAQVAAQKGISLSQFQASFVAAVTPLLAADVSNQSLTQAQETLLLKRFQSETLPPNWNRSRVRIAPQATPVPAS
ncbi:MAG TPA: hypothetical protein VNI34_03190 [Candidatus Nitrosotalea sp.]|nr:hypothetical protein [Candidatus Nitrosotalea sp.]